MDSSITAVGGIGGKHFLVGETLDNFLVGETEDHFLVGETEDPSFMGDFSISQSSHFTLYHFFFLLS